jgi:holo-[acyl-carrier protein] synthase
MPTKTISLSKEISGIGNDIIEIARIDGVIQRHGERFLNKIFTIKEQHYCLTKARSSAHFAGRFAAKEAVVKALGTGFGSIVGFIDIEILNDEAGKPVVYLASHVDDYFEHPRILVSISHCRSYATAFAIVL